MKGYRQGVPKAYLFLILLALITPMAAYFVSDQMIYRFHYHPLAHSNQWFWKRDMSDEDLDRLAHQHSKKFALLASIIISVICIPGFGYLSYLGLTGAFN